MLRSRNLSQSRNCLLGQVWLLMPSFHLPPELVLSSSVVLTISYLSLSRNENHLSFPLRSRKRKRHTNRFSELGVVSPLIVEVEGV
jgi:hypothetical protein